MTATTRQIARDVRALRRTAETVEVVSGSERLAELDRLAAYDRAMAEVPLEWREDSLLATVRGLVEMVRSAQALAADVMDERDGARWAAGMLDERDDERRRSPGDGVATAALLDEAWRALPAEVQPTATVACGVRALVAALDEARREQRATELRCVRMPAEVVGLTDEVADLRTRLEAVASALGSRWDADGGEG